MSSSQRALAANARRNSAGSALRLWRWRGARAAAWALLERHVARGAAVAVVGAGNGHDLPLRRLGHRAGRLDLIDVDERALKRTRRRLRLGGVRAGGITQDVTHGAADAILRHVIAGQPMRPSRAAPVGRPPYDVVIADQFLSQLLYPALSDSHLSPRAVSAALRTHGQVLTNAVVAGLAASAPGGLLICIEDVLGWWAGHDQPFTIDEALAAADLELRQPRQAGARVQRADSAGSGGHGGGRPGVLALAVRAGDGLSRVRDGRRYAAAR